MVADIRTGATVGGAIRYNEAKVNRRQAEVLCWNRMLDPFDTTGRMSHERCMASFEPFLQANRRTTNTVFHVSLNPSPEDHLTDEQLGEIAREYMERMGYGEQPYIVFKHGDIAREHLHIVSLRVDSTGRKISNSHEYDRSMSILRDLERKYGLPPEHQRTGTAGPGGIAQGGLSEGRCQAVDLLHYKVVPAALQLRLFWGVADAAGSLQRLGRRADRHHRRT